MHLITTIIGLLLILPASAFYPMRICAYRSPILYMRKDKSVKPSGNHGPSQPTYVPKTPNQQTYVQYLQDPDTSIVFGVGPAGTGKTMFACSTAIQELKRGNIQKIILTRPIVPVENEELGFLPGNLKQKMDPWTRPMFDIFLEYYTQSELDLLVRNGVIEISPLAYMRGRTFKQSFIIADEMQNSTPNQMLMLTTRIGDGSKMVITGDLAQSDRASTGTTGTSSSNGLATFIQKVKLYYANNEQQKQMVRLIELSNQDIERSPVVSQILEIYQTAKNVDLSAIIKANSNKANNTIDTSSSNQLKEKYRVSTATIQQDAALMPISDCLRSNSGYLKR